MNTAPPAFPLRPTPPMPWRPMTDAEWATLSAILRRGGRGRPPRDERRLWDGIFLVACGTFPWRDMPAGFGRADTAHRALRRAAATHRLHAMLLRVSPHPLMRDDPLQGIAWFVVRAFRRAFRVAPHAIAYARRLGLASALPCAPCWLPDPDLSETVKRIARAAAESAGRLPLGFLRALYWLHRRAGGAPRYWKATG